MLESRLNAVREEDEKAGAETDSDFSGSVISLSSETFDIIAEAELELELTASSDNNDEGEVSQDQDWLGLDMDSPWTSPLVQEALNRKVHT
jgi:hypothetical protein